MSKVVKRGYSINDEQELGVESMEKLHKAGCDLHYLLNQGYKIKGASVFVAMGSLLKGKKSFHI